MPNYDSDTFGTQHSTYRERDDGGREKHSILSLVVTIGVVAVIGVVAITIAFLALGFVFHLVGLILKVAILAAVAAFVWRRVTRHRSHDRI